MSSLINWARGRTSKQQLQTVPLTNKERNVIMALLLKINENGYCKPNNYKQQRGITRQECEKINKTTQQLKRKDITPEYIISSQIPVIDNVIRKELPFFNNFMSEYNEAMKKIRQQRIRKIIQRVQTKPLRSQQPTAQQMYNAAKQQYKKKQQQRLKKQQQIRKKQQQIRKKQLQQYQHEDKRRKEAQIKEKEQRARFARSYEQLEKRLKQGVRINGPGYIGF